MNALLKTSASFVLKITASKNLYLLLLASVMIIPLSAQFAGGSGTAGDPWQIDTAEHLDMVRYYLGEENSDKYFLQIADIDLGVSPWNEGEGWEPIGAADWIYNNPVPNFVFHGFYDGGGHVIDGLYINRPATEFQTGLFGVLMSGAISNLGITNANITGNTNVGTVTGINNGTVLNCYSSGTVTGSSLVGGLVGNTSCTWPDWSNWPGLPSMVLVSWSSCNVFGGSYKGGLVGYIFVSNVENSHSTGNVAGGSGVGGLAGYNDRSIVIYCFSTGNVSGNSYVGGLLGNSFGCWYWDFGSFSYPSLVEDSFSRGSVSGYQFVGGLIGSNQYHNTPPQPGRVGISLPNNRKTEGDRFPDIDPRDDTAISRFRAYVKNCYSTGLVSGSAAVGGLIGLDMDGTYLNNYWDMETSGITTSAAGEGRTTTEMTYPYASNIYADWNFSSIWAADPAYFYNDGYPYLSGMPVSAEEEVLSPITQELVIYPNPFNPETTIRLVNSQIIPDELIIYNIKGQTIKTFREFEQDREGFYINWNGRDERERIVASGVYFAVIRSAGEMLKSGKMILMK